MLLYKVESNNDIALKKKEKENPTYLVSYFFFVFCFVFWEYNPNCHTQTYFHATESVL